MPPPPPRTRAQPDGGHGLFETETGATYLPRTAVDNAAAAADDRAHAYTTLGRAAITAVVLPLPDCALGWLLHGCDGIAARPLHALLKDVRTPAAAATRATCARVNAHMWAPCAA